LVVEQEANFNNAMGQESLTRFDQPKKKTTTKTEISTDLKPTGS
jgi:hypothetical protein